MDLTIGAALLAGLVSFLSPCVLPVVPAYLGQLGVVITNGLSPAVAAIAQAGFATPGTITDDASLLPATVTPRAAAYSPVAGGASGASGAVATSGSVSARSTWGASAGWRAMPNAIAFVIGFGAIFTLTGLTISVAASPLRDNALVRGVGGILVILLGLNLMGILRLSRLGYTWRPLDRFTRQRPGSARRGIVGGFALGAIFAVGWTPCIGPTLGAVLGLAASGPSAQVAILLVAYSLGLGIPFLILAAAVDRAPAITRPLVRHGHAMELIGGTLVVLIGIAILGNWLTWFSQQFGTLWPV